MTEREADRHEENSAPALDLLWGATEIAKVIGRTRRQTFGLLEAGHLPARKIGGRWVASRSDLVAHFAAPETQRTSTSG